MSIARNARRLARRTESLTRHPRPQAIGLAGWHLRVLRQCGAAPYDRAVAAAHEAGHAVVSLTLGGRPGPVTVSESQPGVWTGWTTFQWPPEQRSGEVHPLEHPWEARHAMVVAISGYAGEDAAGLAHPASSPDEVFPVVAGCTAVAQHCGLEADVLVAGVLREAADRIGSNRKLFDAIRHALEASDRVTAEQIDCLVRKHGLVSFPLESAWKAATP